MEGRPRVPARNAARCTTGDAVRKSARKIARAYEVLVESLNIKGMGGAPEAAAAAWQRNERSTGVSERIHPNRARERHGGRAAWR